MSEKVYLEMDVFCIVMLFFIYRHASSNLGSEQEIVSFKRTLLWTMILLVLDSLWFIGQNGLIPYNRLANGVVNALYMASTGVLGYYWFSCSEERLNKDFHRASKWGCLPAVLLIVLALLSIRTGWLFYIDADNVYTRGPQYWLQPVISYIYLLFPCVHAFISGLRESNKEKQQDDFFLAAFGAMPLAGGLLSLFILGYPVFLSCTSMGLLIVFLHWEDAQISTDALTGLNNRRRLDQYLEQLAADSADWEKVILFLGDVDGFKQINDVYGHLEGDRALRIVSEALERVCSHNNAFLARYGGDEFCAVGYIDGDVTPEYLIMEIQKELAKAVKEGGLPYNLSMSVGYCRYSEETATATRLIAAADDMLYEHKERTRNTLRKDQNG